ncbi:7-carboxy-7-deazaguanine synthase : 7-carboxy-7-deazaguanine synthase OS=Singulisphaera acidiphila (strain ATCC BAA-1392 / DSM 18658 / VKM B-2454 / MOB10) GN=queE PE=3 SV=1: Fer4_14: Radical_SAM [Gemmataceae bacterium]|nr:7-carboxy-7-deazaguanine synthase : 7-carboxy-7-deazaguanine synthase OS=Singulisphaera acidiphila (strain ATCC BAA-1392 / DSM 18658 / VKM B-2454 / MOB10) GN=queE PE=3 SV=1: Fer4_14: Radical_SAM [Gemmataceae bacterium]VTU01778.1 7-carboxy-7-deazaguanine synthase : 7-carboxy-7-deazaguanine synthase OS=Singulisphaera acidiphila (strain ATCC BAA-1392 / DSM 18658 / VKM B-2454 / MOB10) GN=queE PE=3 SV=1: Fer4_14: Radical_SAM [Gemmataceae bacterium]
MGGMSELKTISLLESVPPEARHRVQLLGRVPAGELLVHEVYRSVQGESTFAGLPCVFVRLSVCDLRCVWCDTPHAFNRGERMSRADVLAEALAFDCPLVEVTGGEPLLQPDVFPLMSELADAGRTVLLETSGAHDVSRVDRRVHVVMDLKCPDSGECDRNLWANLDALKPTDEIKFVISSRRDWDWAAATIREHQLDARFACLVSPVFGNVQPVELVNWLLESGLQRVRFQLQLHKIVWDPATRGV